MVGWPPDWAGYGKMTCPAVALVGAQLRIAHQNVNSWVPVASRCEDTILAGPRRFRVDLGGGGGTDPLAKTVCII